MTTTKETDGRIESEIAAAKEEAGRQRLRELEQELEAAGEELGASAVEFERAKYARDRARGRHTRAMSKRELFLAGKDA